MCGSLAEYMDSTPELRARRDRMLAMCGEIDENRRHPYKHAADADGIVRITSRLNLFGQVVSLDPPAEIHHDDVGWLRKIWEQGDLLDYELWRSGVR